ncbi:MAG: nuclear transport factor 2 family protein [Anaerolineales bacterium]|jgi:hypothetical protein
MKEITREIVRCYYKAWASQDRSEVRALLHDRLQFTSPQETFDSADAFLGACWNYSEGLTGVQFAIEVYEDSEAFVILVWFNEVGSGFTDAEYLQVGREKIKRIVVVNNDPSFGAQVNWR